MGNDSGKEIKVLIVKITICILFAVSFALIETNLGYKKIPFNRLSINEIKNDMNSKIQQVKDMNTELKEISQKTPALVMKEKELIRKAGAKLKKEEGIINDIPSMLVFLDQTGKNSGFTIKKIDIEGLEGTQKKADKNEKDSGKKVVITAACSYRSFCDFIREIQINAKEQMVVKNFEFISNNTAVSTCKIEIKVYL